MIKLGLKSAVSMLVLAMLFGGANRVMAQYQEGDLNHDGVIDVADLTQIIDMMANGGGMITPLPEERREFRKFRPNNVEAIDLGLPSQRKWANKNIGADKVEDFGVFFAWGEVEGRYGYLPERLNPSLLETGTTPRKFDWPSYEFNKGENSWETIWKYQYPDNHMEGCWYDAYGLYNGDNRFHLEDADDAAKYHWDTSWRLPNYVDIMELTDTLYTSQEWTSVNGVYGCLFKSKNPDPKYQNATLFLPAAGQADDKYVQYRSDMNGFGHCFYWTSDIYQHHTADAYVLDIDKYLYGMDMRENEDQIAIISWYHRYLGCSIRPVKDDK